MNINAHFIFLGKGGKSGVGKPTARGTDVSVKPGSTLGKLWLKVRKHLKYVCFIF